MKTLSGMGRLLALMTAVSATLLQGSPAAAQAPTATLHGRVTNPVGAALKTGDVKLTTDKGAEKDRTYKFDFPIDANGDYKGANITPGDYLVVVIADGKTIDYQQVTLKGGQDAPLDFDMTRAEYLKSMTPEDRAKLEEYKKKNASITADNMKIANINKTLAQARQDEKNGKAEDAVKALSDLTQQKADEPVLWASLGEAQLASADAAAAAAKAAKTSPTDPAILQKYSDSAASYQKAIDLNANAKKPSPENLAASYLNMGQALAKSGKVLKRRRHMRARPRRCRRVRVPRTATRRRSSLMRASWTRRGRRRRRRSRRTPSAGPVLHQGPVADSEGDARSEDEQVCAASGVLGSLPGVPGAGSGWQICA